MTQWIPLHVHSDASLLDGLSKCNQIVERCIKLNYPAAAITDHGSLANAVRFIKSCKDGCICGHQKVKHGEKKCRTHGCTCEGFVSANIKPILGCEFYISPQDATIKDPTNRKCSHLVVLAKNLEGWRSLVKATSKANEPDHIWYKKPRLSIEQLAAFSKNNLLCFSGHLGSDLANVVFKDLKSAYSAKTYEEAKSIVRDDWDKAVLELAGKYQELFGKENFWLETQLIDAVNLPAASIVVKILRWVSKRLRIPCVATCDAHYPSKEDAKDQRIQLCSQFETTLNTVERKIANGEDPTLAGFFKSNNYHIPSLPEMELLHKDNLEELQATIDIADKCETYNILGKTILPNFKCPNDMSQVDYIRQLCANGWNSKIEGKIPKEKLPEYKERVKHELDVITNAGLQGYFLIVADYIDYARKQNWLIGPGRGSGAGCIVSYLLNITSIDPIEYNLLFERFYNAGRNTKDRISFPDIDSDFPKQHREEVIEYIRNKYGRDKVSQMVTFGRMQGKSAIKDVLRAHEVCTYEEMNEISKFIPADSEISDDLQKMEEETGESSMIRWALENNGRELSKWCHIQNHDDIPSIKRTKSDGELEGEFAPYFAQAMRLEGTKRSQGKHASGIVMAPYDLAEICPMIYDKSENCLLAGWEMGDLEATGLLKFDILGVTIFDKIAGVVELLKEGKFVA